MKDIVLQASTFHDGVKQRWDLTFNQIIEVAVIGAVIEGDVPGLRDREPLQGEASLV